MKKPLLHVILGWVCVSFVQPCMAADPWPANPLKLVVTFPAGGNIGAEFAAKSAPDGYTLLMATSLHVTNRSFYKNLDYDFLQDFTPVSRVAFVPNMRVVNPSQVRANNLAEFIKLVKDGGNKSRLNYGSGGSGTSHHLATALFNSMKGVEMEHVPYKGGAPAATALPGGQVPVLFAPLVEVLAFIESGKVKALGVTTKQRSALYPDVPAIGELLPGYEVALWNGIMIPAATPADIVSKINAAVLKALAQPDIKQRFAEQGSDPAGTTTDEIKQFIAGELDKWACIVKISGAKVE